MLASIVISTYNRAGALASTLKALGDQDTPAAEYEVLVVDDGSTDATPEVLASLAPPYLLRTYRLPTNQGVSAGRNVGLCRAEGRYIIMISDDLLVPRDFVSTHVATLDRFPDAWVVGGFAQLESVAETSFGRFLDERERCFAEARLGRHVADGVYEMTVPTARNLSLRRASLERVGLFDERFRVTCEDQDLAYRAAQHRVRFIYNEALKCIHNDQSAELDRYCRFQRYGARDTARLCEKYPSVHSRGQVARANAYVARSDGVALALRKLTKQVLGTPLMMRLLGAAVTAAERAGLPDRWLHRGYRAIVGLHFFRGFREGLAEVGGRRSQLVAQLREPPHEPTGS